MLDYNRNISIIKPFFAFLKTFIYTNRKGLVGASK